MQLPSRVVVDSGFTIRGLGQRREEGKSAACRAVWVSLIEARCEILIPAPIIAELARGKDPIAVPRTRQIIPIPFDVDAADHLAKFGSLTYPAGREGGYWKYDMLIAACAAGSGAEALISLDEWYFKDPIKRVLGGLKAVAPEVYLDPQRPFETASGDPF